LQEIVLQEGECKLLSNLHRDCTDEGGTRILAYKIIVFLGSIPFIAMITWRANTWGLTKRSAFFIAFLLCGDVMVFPSALRSGWVSWWLSSITLLMVLGASWPSIIKGVEKIKINSQKDNYAETKNNEEIMEQIKVNPINCLQYQSFDMIDVLNGPEIILEEESYKFEIIENLIEISDLENNSEVQIEYEGSINQIHLYEELTSEEPTSEEPTSEEPISEESISEELISEESISDIWFDSELSNITQINDEVAGTIEVINEEGPSDLLTIDELLELGFIEKNAENFSQAAVYFMRALAMEPDQDIAFYLILDCYWFWKRIGETRLAFSQIVDYAKRYVAIFSPDLKGQFEVWLKKEDLEKYF
jgi:hypothetical protein